MELWFAAKRHQCERILKLYIHSYSLMVTVFGELVNKVISLYSRGPTPPFEPFHQDMSNSSYG